MLGLLLLHEENDGKWGHMMPGYKEANTRVAGVGVRGNADAEMLNGKWRGANFTDMENVEENLSGRT
jgi:hypothetical protein